jgi:hypothetical protein
MTLKLFISLPKKYDKEDAIFERVPCQKGQKAIRISKNKETLKIKKKQKEDKPCSNCGVLESLHYPTINPNAPLSCHEFRTEKVEAGLEEQDG